MRNYAKVALDLIVLAGFIFLMVKINQDFVAPKKVMNNNELFFYLFATMWYFFYAFNTSK